MSNDDIKQKLEEMPGVTIRSHIFLDRAWLDNGQLSRWVNGRRYCFIDVPEITLSKTLKVGAFEANLYYKERPKDVMKCWDCKEEGHKRGDSECQNPRAPWSTREPKEAPEKRVSESHEEEKNEEVREEVSDATRGESLLNDLRNLHAPSLDGAGGSVEETERDGEDEELEENRDVEEDDDEVMPAPKKRKSQDSVTSGEEKTKDKKEADPEEGEEGLSTSERAIIKAEKAEDKTTSSTEPVKKRGRKPKTKE